MGWSDQARAGHRTNAFWEASISILGFMYSNDQTMFVQYNKQPATNNQPPTKHRKNDREKTTELKMWSVCVCNDHKFKV